jgi:hypothetical protein
LSEILENNPAPGGKEEVTEERWHLYLAPFNSETAAIAMAERYARATPTHVMIYNEKDECPDGFKEMTEETLYLLPVEDRKWLKEVNNIIIQQFICYIEKLDAQVCAVHYDNLHNLVILLG